MDVAVHLQHFECSLSSYFGDDPLDMWVRFVEFLEKKYPDRDSMGQVLDRLVERLLNVKRYANDIRFVNYCIRCASFHAEPAAMFSNMFSRGVGTKTASFYLAWAQDLEQKDQREQADAVYKKAMENQAQPAETLLHEYRMFESRTLVQNVLPAARNPLQDSRVHNQRATFRENQAPVEFFYKPGITETIIISRSDTVPVVLGPSSKTLAAYSEPGLDHDGSELCFEELRARRYFSRIQEKKKGAEQVKGEGTVMQEVIKQLKCELEVVQQQLDVFGEKKAGEAATDPDGSVPVTGPHSAARGPLSCRSWDRTTNQCETAPGLEEKLNLSQDAAAGLTHVTPNTSFGFSGATPSRVLPSPTVNTREALDVIMDMFQAPTLLSDSLESSFLPGPSAGPAGAATVKPAAANHFTIFQDEEDKENAGAAAAAAASNKSRTSRVLAPIPVSRTVTSSDVTPDETTWGAGDSSVNSVAPCPNSTRDFAMWAALVSTPATHQTPVSAGFYPGPDASSQVDPEDAAFSRRPSRKLSPIMEQSPAEDGPGGTAPAQKVQVEETVGTIMVDCSAPHNLSLGPPPALLSFRDQTLGTSESSRGTAGPGWEVYMSPGNPVPSPGPSVCPGSNPLTAREDLERLSGSPRSPSRPVCESRLCADVSMSPEQKSGLCADVSMSPEQKSGLCADVSMSPEQKSRLCADVPMSPEQKSRLCADVPMSPEPQGNSGGDLVNLLDDPWDSQLITNLLASITPPLSAHPRCITWTGNIPRIRPKTTISIGSTALQVDCVLGEGAFAKVYRARDLLTSEKMVLKVQKAASRWEFYIQTQLDSRLQPQERHLFSRVSSAHMFDNGSVLLGDLHELGTLLNTVNLYKALPERVMPQPLVLYFTSCILNSLQVLHRINILHADVKPDNFLLGKRFLDNQCLDPESLDHGLVLIDYGQSIDLRLFPPGTAFTARCETSGFQCTEMLSGRPWSYQTDLFGAAGTVFSLLFGTYMKVVNEGGVWRTSATFRRLNHGDLWLDLFHALLNVSAGAAQQTLSGLQARVAAVLRTHYASRLASLKNRLLVLLLEARPR